MKLAVALLLVVVLMGGFLIYQNYRNEQHREHPSGAAQPYQNQLAAPVSVQPMGMVSMPSYVQPSQEPSNEELTRSLTMAAQPAVHALGDLYKSIYTGEEGSRFLWWKVNDVSTDVEKTSSLTSPYVGTVAVTAYVETTPSQDFPEIHGGTEHQTLIFAYQNGRWVQTGIQ